MIPSNLSSATAPIKVTQFKTPVTTLTTKSDEISNKESREAITKYQQLVDELEEYQIDSIGFSLLSDEDINKLSTVRISMDAKTNGPNSINSKEMGSTKREEICTKCKLRFPQCNGHYGHIELPEPIIHPLLKKDLIKVMSVVCHHCGKVRMLESSIEASGIMKSPAPRRLKELYDLVGNEMSCPNINCLKSNKTIATGDHKANKLSYKGGGYLEIDTIIAILQRLSPSDIKLMGYENGSHPKNIIITKLLVIPPIHRPDIIINGGVKHADLTEAYSAIIRACTDYSSLQQANKTKEELSSQLEKISREVHKLFTNPDSGSGQDNKGILENFKGKEGSIVRQGRRTNLNARSVLGPGTANDFGEISIPIEQAKALSRQEIVTQYNIKKIKEYMAMGQIGSLIPAGKSNKVKIDDQNRWKYLGLLKPGDTIYRHTMDGDLVVFNRQPTLQKESMTVYRTKIWNKRTIGLHLVSTSPHNADFDGDEGNIYGILGPQALAEAEYIMGTWNNIISSQSAKPNAGLVMNALSGGYALTADNVLVPYQLFYECLDVMNNLDGTLFDIREFMKRAIEQGLGIYSTKDEKLHKLSVEELQTVDYKPDFFDGRVLFSIFLPPRLQYRKSDVIIQNGILIQGQIGKQHIGSSHGSIVQVIYSDFGTNEACRFITNATKVLDIYAYRRGITVGIYEYCPWLGNTEKKMALDDKRREIIVDMEGKIAEMPVPDSCNIELMKRYENKIVEHMEQATNAIGIEVLGKFADKDGGIAIMANSGAKGSSINAAHTTGMIGPQYNRGERMALCITNNTRTTPYVLPNETSVVSRGFITSNYSEGVTPLDAAHAAVSTRNSIVDTAVGVGDTGYLSRKLMRYLEDINTSYNGGVIINAYKSSASSMDVRRSVSLIYGDDNYDTTKLELVSTPVGSVFLPIDIYRLVSKLNSKHGTFQRENKLASPYTGPIEYED
jgi:DNA-directed RNA polymerase beta' subunit